MKLVTLPTVEKEEALTIREQASKIVTEGSEHYDEKGDVILITLDSTSTGISIHSTMDILDTIGLLEIAKAHTMGD
ncbi:hypothetical protein N8314_00760 [Akkermansiaceae bacterium]|nr:hypothetical protein [Akkermansiaceae bacterium]